MKFSLAIAAAALAAGVSAGSNATVTTQIVTAYTTYCPGSTTFSHGGTTYTVTEATTLTIIPSSCACSSTTVLPIPTSASPAPVSSPVTVSTSVVPVTSVTPATPVAPTSYTSAPYSNGTVTSAVSVPAGTGSATQTIVSASTYTGAAVRHAAGGAIAGLAAVAMMAF